MPSRKQFVRDQGSTNLDTEVSLGQRLSSDKHMFACCVVTTASPGCQVGFGKHFQPNTSRPVGRNPKPQGQGQLRFCGRPLLSLGTVSVPGAGAGADLLSVVEAGRSGQQIKSDSLATPLTKLTSQPKESWMGGFWAQFCYHTEGTPSSASGLFARLLAPPCNTNDTTSPECSLRRTGTSDRNPLGGRSKLPARFAQVPNQ